MHEAPCARRPSSVEPRAAAAIAAASMPKAMGHNSSRGYFMILQPTAALDHGQQIAELTSEDRVERERVFVQREEREIVHGDDGVTSTRDVDERYRRDHARCAEAIACADHHAVERSREDQRITGSLRDISEGGDRRSRPPVFAHRMQRRCARRSMIAKEREEARTVRFERRSAPRFDQLATQRLERVAERSRALGLELVVRSLQEMISARELLEAQGELGALGVELFEA